LTAGIQLNTHSYKHCLWPKKYSAALAVVVTTALTVSVTAAQAVTLYVEVVAVVALVSIIL
jgi:hypothetical protein